MMLQKDLPGAEMPAARWMTSGGRQEEKLGTVDTVSETHRRYCSKQLTSEFLTVTFSIWKG